MGAGIKIELKYAVQERILSVGTRTTGTDFSAGMNSRIEIDSAGTRCAGTRSAGMHNTET